MKTDFRNSDHLKSIKGDRTTSRAWRRMGLDESEQVTCWRCLQDIGIETSAVTQITLAPRRKSNGKITAGTKVWVCVHCLSRGETTELVR